jgi:hypothetical protein
MTTETQKPRLRLSRLRVDIHEHGGFTGKVTIQVSIIGVKKEDLASIDHEQFSKNIMKAAVAHLQESYTIEEVKL